MPTARNQRAFCTPITRVLNSLNRRSKHNLMAKRNDKNVLNERSSHLFKVLVEHFIGDGQPVGSRTLARDSDLDLSSATIRNVMSDLEDFGLLTSPHTSSGRIPTVKGYRLFVDTMLQTKQLTEDEVRKLSEQLDINHNTQSLMAKASEALSDITSLASVVMLPRLEQQAIEHIEFLPLSDNRILVIIVANENDIQNRVIHTSRQYSAAELQEAANYLNDKFTGKPLDLIRNQIVTELESMKRDVNHLMQMAIEVAQQAFLIDQYSDDYVLSGETNLMGAGDLSDVEKLRRLFESFNQKRDILHLLEQSIHARGLQIFIGEESGYEVFDDCSVITSPYESSNGEILGVLGVIGPTRMNYQRVIPIVDITAKMLGQALKSQN